MENLNSGEGNAQRDGQERLDERKADATSKDTLDDIEESATVPDPMSEGAPQVSETPSPDGALDETRNKPDDAGPM